MSNPGAKRPSPSSNAQSTTESKQAAAATDQKRQKTAPVIVCPYLDTIDRKVLDFDFEKLCSISLSNMNVYACLVCGKYFQGRGLNSHAYFHSLDSGHHVFINLQTEKIYCLPDNYEVIDSSLEDIRFNLHPKLRTTELVAMDQKPIYTHALDGRTYMPGLVGLNNIKNTDWLNAVIQALVRIAPLRNYFAVEDNWAGHKTQLVQRFGELVAKMWSPRSFKGHVSPHELLQAISTESNKQFKIGVQADPLVFLSWFLNRLHIDLGGSRKPNSSIIYKTFQGEIRIEQQEPILSKEAERKTSGKGAPDEFSQLIKQQHEQDQQAAEERAQEDGDIDEEMAQAQADLEAQEAQQADPLTAGLASGPSTADGVAPIAPEPVEDETKVEPVANNVGFKRTIKYTPFLYLSLSLPAAPLFKDTADRSLIPQVPIYDLLNKFDGETEETTADGFRKKYMISRLPRFLIVHVKRFSDNNWFVEKNVTLVNFPIKNLDLRPYLLQPPQPSTEELRAKSGSELKALCKTLHLEVAGAVEKDDLINMITAHYKKLSETLASRYDLIANIVHEGSRVPQEAQEAKSIGGNYKVHVYHKPTDTWYEIQDLSVVTTEMIAQQVALSEAYIQFYELKRPGS